MQSEFGISDIDESRLVPQRNISNDYNPQLYNGNRSQLRTPSISVDRSEKSPSPRNRVGRSPILSKLYDNTRLIPNNLGKVGVKQMNATDKRLMFQNNHNHPKSMMSNLSHRSLRSNAVDQERNQSDIIQATHDLLFQGLTPN